MPMYKIADTNIDVCREAILVDTNVLVAAFSPNEAGGLRETAQLFLTEVGRPLLVLIAVIVEAVGVISLGKRTDATAVLGLLEWLEAPGRATLVPTSKVGLTVHAGS